MKKPNKIEQHQEELAQAKKFFRFSRFLLVPALCLWPLGLLINPAVSFFIFMFFFAMFCICTYISFMHRLDAQKKLAQAIKEEELHTNISSS